jgi:hypothetical protein
MPSYSFGPEGIVTSDNSYPHEYASSNYSGWVGIGSHQGPSPYPKMYYKIAQHIDGNGTREYEIWNNGDANHEAGGRYIIRLNSWYNGQPSFTSVSLRCISGNRTDMTLYPYNNSNGIWIAPGFIWGSFLIRKRGYDEGGHSKGAAYCAVDNGGPLASATSLPSGALTSLQADSMWDIENNGVRNG